MAAVAVKALASWMVAGAAVAADVSPLVTDQLPGLWEPFSFASSNCFFFEGATNISLCVYGVNRTDVFGPGSDSELVLLDVELRSKDHNGQERIVPHTQGETTLTKRMIHFGGLGGVVLDYSLTNGVLILERHFHGTFSGTNLDLDFKAELKKVASVPPVRLLPPPSEKSSATKAKLLQRSDPFLVRGDYPEELGLLIQKVFSSHRFLRPWTVLKSSDGSIWFVAEREIAPLRFDRLHVQINPQREVSASITAYQFIGSDWAILGPLARKSNPDEEAETVANEISKPLKESNIELR